MKQSNLGKLCGNCSGEGYVWYHGPAGELLEKVDCWKCHGTGRIEHNTKDSEANTDTARLPQSNPDTLELKNFAAKFDLSLTQAQDILAWAESLVPEKKEPKAHSNEADTPISEGVCQVCGGQNPVWFAPNELWNQVIGDSLHFTCPNCFIWEAEKQGVALSWRVEPE